MRNRSYDVVPVPGRKEYPSRAYPPRVFPPQIPTDSAAVPSFQSEEHFPPLSPSQVSQLDPRTIDLEEPPLGETDSWQTAQSRRSARNTRQSSQASRVMSETAARTSVVLPAVVSVMPVVSSASSRPASAEVSEFVSERPASAENPIPSGSLLQRGLPASAEATSVVLPSVNYQSDSSNTDPAIAEFQLSDAQRQYIVNATLLARALSPEQLLQRSERINLHLRNIARYEDEAVDPPLMPDSPIDSVTTRLVSRINRKNKRKERRSIVNPVLPVITEVVVPTSLPASAEANSVAPVISAVDSSTTTLTEVVSLNTLPNPLSFNPYYDRTTPQLSGQFTRQTVLDVTQILTSYRCPFTPADCVPASERSRFLSLLQRRYHNDAVGRQDCRNWETWSVTKFCKELKEAVPDITVAQAQIMGFNEVINRVKVNFDMQQPSVEELTVFCVILKKHIQTCQPPRSWRLSTS